MIPLIEQLEEIKLLLELQTPSHDRDRQEQAARTELAAYKKEGRSTAAGAIQHAKGSTATYKTPSARKAQAHTALTLALDAAKGKWKIKPHTTYLKHKEHPRGLKALESTSLAEQLEDIRSFLSERARWKKEFEKHDIAIPRAKHPEIELTSTKRQRRKGEFTTRGARPDPEGRQADAGAQKAFGRKHPKTGEIEKEEPEVHQTGSSGSEGEERERRTNVRRLGRWKRGSWMGAAIRSANQMNKAARRARTREMDPRRGLRAVARAATRKGLRKRSKSGWETKPRPPEGEVGFRGPADRRV